jgi:hypothetical protein
MLVSLTTSVNDGNLLQASFTQEANLPSASFTVHSGDKYTADVSNAGVRLQTFSRNVKEKKLNDANGTIGGRREDDP